MSASLSDARTDLDVLYASEAGSYAAIDAYNHLTNALIRLDRLVKAVENERRWATGTAEHNDARTALYALVTE